jgi:agmatinase
MDDIHARGIEPVVDEFLQHLAGLPYVFLSVDIDVCDPAFAPGTGTPEPGGLHARELLRAVRRIASSVPVAGIEVVEVSPPFDPAGITALLAHRIVLEVLSGMALRRSGRPARPERP